MQRAETYGFRPVAAADLPILAGWLEMQHVRRWWGDPAEVLASIEEHMHDPFIALYMVSLNGENFAYVQVADLAGEEAFADQPERTCGMDQFIGPEAFVGRGHGPRFMARLCRTLFAQGHRRVVVDPHPENAFAIRAYSKAGFQRLGETITNDGPALLMVMDRQENDRQ